MTADPLGDDRADVESLTAFRERARAWLAGVEIPPVPMDIEERFEVLRRWQRTLYEGGWLGVGWPRRFGGGGLTLAHQFVVTDELVRARAPAPIGLIGVDVVGASIVRFGTDAQRARFLLPLLSGAEIWCQGFSEPDAGSDLAALSTRAVADGDTFVVSGQKIWTSWAHKAHWCALLCRTDPTAPVKHAGISYLLVDMATPGITVRPIEQMTGEAEFCEVFLDDVRVPAENLLGELNGGWPLALDTLGNERGFYTLRRRVELEAALDGAVAQVRGSPLRGDPRVVEEIGRAHLALRVLEAQSRRTVARLLDGSGAGGPMDSVDKLLLNDTDQTVYQAVTELLGPFRVAASARPLGLDAGRWVRDHYYSRAASIYGGTAQIQRNIVAERLLGMPKG